MKTVSFTRYRITTLGLSRMPWLKRQRPIKCWTRISHPQVDWPKLELIFEILISHLIISLDLSREPLQFPNLVNGFDRNPERAARSALYTRYTPSEWHKSCMNLYNESDVNRQFSERLRNDAVRLMRQTDEKTVQGQREAGRRLGERLTDLTFWRNELSIELEKVISEYSLLADMKRRTTKALEDLDPPLKVTEECLYFRENRQGVEKVHDVVEKSLLVEVQNLKTSQDRLKQCIEQVGFIGIEYDSILTMIFISRFYLWMITIWNPFRSISYYRTCVPLNTRSKKILFTRRTRLVLTPFATNWPITAAA